MPKQPTFPGLRHAVKKKQTRREKFLAEMETVVPWMRLLALIAPHYPKAGPRGGRPPMPIETMLRVYFLQQWYALSDPMAEEMLYDSDAMRRFAGIELGDDRIPDETTILNFRHLLEKHQLTEQLFAEVNRYLADQGITLRSGTLVDATIIDAPSSTKNKAKARDPEMSSTKKGNAWYFGMKAHVGVDVDSGTVHSLEATTAKVHDSRIWDELLHGGETSVWADKGYVSAEREAAFTKNGKVWGVMRKAPRGGKLDEIDEETNRVIAMVRAKVEHPFRVLKRQFGHMKTRYRGLAKNRAQLFTLFALGNLFLVRRQLLT
ncbi:IS5 family transposase [Stappia sp. 28M-7]|uniref:IS5 family transposase n=1 Tax=Stappia sp. 28M-7 TaxID=2762596 RepID=UPI00163B93AF|nr:IS5 family transposase [Stappia sp. 28M-7]MBC2861630.1 IS5 family transposase [Stappia sp. 28M-7]